MPKITFSKHHHTEHLHFWTWRGDNRRAAGVRAQDEEQATMFAERAGELREELEFLLSGGLSEGAEDTLNTLAEEDMADFCIMVDLAEGVDIPGVEPLQEDTREHLSQFLEHPTWHALIVDNDITVALAMLDNIGTVHANRPWYEYAPHLMEVLARVLDNAEAEQVKRFIGEYNQLAQRDDLHLPDELPQMFNALVQSACKRLGIAPLEIRQ